MMCLVKELHEQTEPPKSLDGGAVSLALPPPELADRTAGEPEIARWVSRNIDNPAPDLDKCPDPFAYTLLRMCRENPGFAMMYVKDIWTKLLVSKVRHESDRDGSSKDIDGTPTLKMIARIQVISEKTIAANQPPQEN